MSDFTICPTAFGRGEKNCTKNTLCSGVLLNPGSRGPRIRCSINTPKTAIGRTYMYASHRYSFQEYYA